uniref:NTR domain-containing protein n=1 Tax=Steinernema glaseri TaxID=37863 RepID=A0A1I7ZIF8_9BILA
MFRALILLSVVSVAIGCDCPQRSPKQLFCNSDFVGTFTITHKKLVRSDILYEAETSLFFKTPKDYPYRGARIYTNSQSTACGVTGLEIGRTYLLNGDTAFS